MSIYAISDLHLSSVRPKPMDIFGINWINHWDKIKEDWLKKVEEQDVVLIPGDISWAMTLDEAVPDLLEIADLPGRKIITRGNHDYWWSSLSKMRKVFPESINIIQNDFIDIGEFIVCGTRGWMLPGDERFTAEDEKIYNRELIRLELSLSKAAQSAEKSIIAMLHYPPFNDKRESSGFVDLMARYNVNTCIYGHLHGESLKNVKEGVFFGIRFLMVSCDYLDFHLINIF